MEQRLQKILSEMGIASRRRAEGLILEGRVMVNGRAAELGMKADTSRDHIKVDGKLLIRAEPKAYLIMNKPRGVVTSLFDPEGRPTVKDFLSGIKQRVYPVGRLDYDSEGLLFFTNDGDLAQSVLHPSRKIPKTYMVKVKGIIENEALKKLSTGMRIEGALTAPAKTRKIREGEQNSWIEITIHEGRKRQIRQMLERVGHPVLKLKRIRIGSLKLGDLKPGEIRRLTPDELNKLREETAGG
ncbi:MAG: pseudouridine synthase [Thermodesulfovibrionales bacterium]|nr:pseudouridine synthase [Thermodesulfovibrionales bacterium]